MGRVAQAGVTDMALFYITGVRQISIVACTGITPAGGAILVAGGAVRIIATGCSADVVQAVADAAAGSGSASPPLAPLRSTGTHLLRTV